MKGNLIIPSSMFIGIEKNCNDSDPNNIVEWYTGHILSGFDTNKFTIDKNLVSVLKVGKYYHFELACSENAKALRGGGAVVETKFKIVNAIECKDNSPLLKFDKPLSKE